MAMLLSTWENLISTTLNPSKANLPSLPEELTQVLIYQSQIERDKIRTKLIDGIVNKPQIKDKRQFIQLNQAMVIRLLDKLHAYKQQEKGNERMIYLYNSISQHLESILNFIEDFFGNYFDRNERVPAGYLTISSNEICRLSKLVNKVLMENGNVDAELIDTLEDNFDQFCSEYPRVVTYNDLLYQKELVSELYSDNILDSEIAIREVLFYLNFNNDDYIGYLFNKLSTLCETLPSKKEKIAALRYEQKKINQLRIKLNCCFSPFTPSLKDQVNSWIEEEIKFLESDLVSTTTSKNENEQDDKIHTSLSVAKLALILKVMVLDKIITNRVVTHVLRVAVKTVTTLQKENIAFGSLETKYHNPDRGTISAVKDMLFRWINIVNKL